MGRMEGDPSPDSPTVNEVDRLLGHTELARVFDFLSPEDLLGRAAFVCKRWQVHFETYWLITSP